MSLSRREFLKLILGTAPAVALSGSLSALWPEKAKARPVSDPVTLFLNQDNLLVDGPWREISWSPSTRREHYGLDEMSLQERLEFWFGWLGKKDGFRAFLDACPHVDDWTAEHHQAFLAHEADHSAWLDEELPFDEMSELDLAFLTEHGPALGLFEHLGEKRAEALGLYETVVGGPGGGGYGIGFRGDVDKLNAKLAALGINVVVAGRLDDDDEYWDDNDEEASA